MKIFSMESQMYLSCEWWKMGNGRALHSQFQVTLISFHIAFNEIIIFNSKIFRKCIRVWCRWHEKCITELKLERFSQILNWLFCIYRLSFIFKMTWMFMPMDNNDWCRVAIQISIKWLGFHRNNFSVAPRNYEEILRLFQMDIQASPGILMKIRF